MPEGRVIFESSAQAQDAVARIDGNVEFDAGCLLTASLASENLQVDESQAQGKHPKVDPYPAPVTPSALVQPYAATGQPGGLLPAFPSGGMAPYGFAGAAPVATLTPRMYAPVKNEMDNPPCNTLFIGNLGEGVDENELRAVFG